MIQKEVVVSPDHPILFIEDMGNNDVTVPEHNPNYPVSSNENCISFDILSYVDGETYVKLVDHENFSEKITHEKVFFGDIRTPEKKLCIATAENKVVLKTHVGNTITSLRIWVDEKKNPSSVVIEVV